MGRLYTLAPGRVVTTISTLGHNVKTFKYRDIGSRELMSRLAGLALCQLFTLWDIGPFKQHWRHYYVNTQGAIFVVDSGDAPVMDAAKESLQWILSSERAKGIPLLVLANKQDFTGALDVDSIKEHLGIGSTVDRACYVQPCSAISGAGLDWLVEVIRT